MLEKNPKFPNSDSAVKWEINAIVSAFMVTLETIGIGASILAISGGELNLFQPTIHFFAWIFCAVYLGAWRNDRALSNESGFVPIVKSAILAVPITAFLCTYFSLPINFEALLTSFSLGLFVMFFLRWLTRKVVFELRLRSLLLMPALVVGDKDEISNLSNSIVENRMFGYSVGEAIDSTETNQKQLNLISSLISSNRFGAIFLGDSFMKKVNGFSQIVWEARKAGLEVFIDPQAAVVSLGRTLPVQAMNSLLLKLDSQAFSKGAQVTKRVFDVALSSILLLLTLPIQILIVLLILLIDRQSPIFTQLRVGKAGHTFPILKFRTMKEHPISELSKGEFEKAGNEVQFKLKSDPRVTPLGKVLRRFSLDELPQLFNVLLGQMSLVGPRPHVATEVSKYTQTALRRLDIRPGLTGAWQVGGRSDLDWEKSLALDLDYIQNWSLSLDFVIIVKTVWAVIRGKGAY